FMVEYNMANWFFDADDDNLMMMAGTRIKAFDDRLFLQAVLTNGNESQFPNTQMDQYPGVNVGFWYDIGGTPPQAPGAGSDRPLTSGIGVAAGKTPFGDYLSDLDYSCTPIIRVGGAADIVPMGRRSLYGDNEQSRVFVMPGGPQGGTRLINVLSGAATAPGGSHAVDEFDSYSFDTFACFKYKGFSISNEWYLRDLNNFRTTPNVLVDIIYTDSLGHNALFPHHALLDYGSTLQGGYFIVPKKWELVARFSFVRGESGDINGTGKVTTVTLPGIAGKVDVVN